MRRPADGLNVPSKTLLRYLKAHNDIHYSRSRSCRPQSLSTKCRVLYFSTGRPYKDETKAKQHEPFKALPPPRQYIDHPHSRHASTRAPRPQHEVSNWSKLWSKWQQREAKLAQRQKQQSRADDPDAQLFNLSRALARSATTPTDLKLRCTEFDANGSVTLVSGEFKKSELIAKYGLLPRDLRKIDSSVLPHILVRPTCILLNLLHLRVLIQSDRVLVFDAYGSTDSYTQSLFMYDLEGKLRQKPDPRHTTTYLPYEFRALEAVLISVTSGLEAEFALVRDPVTHILRELEEDIDRDKLRHLLVHSKKLGTFEQKARLVRDAINDLLEADDDLAAMYLTERQRTGSQREDDNHQEIEMLLESYHKICDEIVEISGNLISNIRNTEEVIRAILDANRNQLMLLEIKFSIGTLGLAGGTLIAGLYGMNLNSFIEETDWGFGAVTAVSFVLSGIIAVYGMRKLRKVQKVRMWGEGIDPYSTRQRHIGGLGNWRNEAMESAAYHEKLRWLKEKGWIGSNGGPNGGLHGDWKHWYYQQNTSQPWAQPVGGNPNVNPASGPVLWPGMDGLGMHEINTAGSSRSNAGGQVDEETGHGYSARPEQPQTAYAPAHARSQSEPTVASDLRGTPNPPTPTEKSEADQYGMYIHDDVDSTTINGIGERETQGKKTKLQHQQQQLSSKSSSQ